MIRPADEQALVEGLKAGDNDAAKRYYDLYAGRLTGWLVSRGVPEADAEDLATRALLHVYQRIDMMDPAVNSLQQWVYQKADWLSKDYFRRKALGQEVPLEDPVGAYDQEIPCLSEGAGPEREQRAAKVRTALARLPEKRRMILQLRYDAGLQHREIAQYLGIREGNARVLLTRAREALKQELLKDPEFSGFADGGEGSTECLR